jgi:FlaG/FlaF family flagellin (archaellin)
MNKKAISIWISWILMVALMISVGAFMYSWITKTTETATESFKYVYDRTECNNIAVLIEACNQSQTLYINVSNKMLLAVDGLVFRVHYFGYDSNTSNQTVKINPGEKKDYSVEIDDSKTLTGLEVIPIVQTEDFRIICRSRMASIANISSC